MRQLPAFFRPLWTMALAILCAASPLCGQTPAPIRDSVAKDAALEQLLKQVDMAVEVNSHRYLTANSHSPWQIFHGILALRQNFQVKLGEKKISAIEWIATGETKFDNEPLIVVTPHGANFHSFTRPYAFQGHPGQFLALLTQSNLPTDYKFRADGKHVTISDMIRDTMMNVNSKEEVTWVLWSLNHYLKSDATWTNKDGDQWSIEKLVQTESAAVVENAACGGNHGLFALSRARDKYLKSGQRLRGYWLVADQKVKRYADVARSLQNADGSFSADFYKGPKFSQDLNTRFNTTGHTLEFLAASLPENRLHETWVRNAVWMLSKDLFDHRKDVVDCGPLYHSLNALILYRERVRKDAPAQVVQQPVIQPTSVVVPSPSRAEPQLLDGSELPISALKALNLR